MFCIRVQGIQDKETWPLHKGYTDNFPLFETTVIC
ncbi:hypothetical protein HNY73_020493 [Argiope bruennichi]|uniref:Uncharacterized protein n=1 Tax=Argiope bruennichi TaxID=94029 RepID=A0A8T0E6Z4_ARGBR|nr:hypothetical protein HNY73_020493 [Argiope bruennichi]